MHTSQSTSARANVKLLAMSESSHLSIGAGSPRQQQMRPCVLSRGPGQPNASPVLGGAACSQAGRGRTPPAKGGSSFLQRWRAASTHKA
eukprot:3758896-Prymnesium_polylepis.1